ERKSLATNEVNRMEILYWAPNQESEEMIFEAMRKTYDMIHTYKDYHFYGESYEPVYHVLTFNEEPENSNILNEL
ncbi:MAG: GNAT family N-acetyltransferase, partial [Bacillus sp. (in: firmicutes)]